MTVLYLSLFILCYTFYLDLLNINFIYFFKKTTIIIIKKLLLYYLCY